MRKKLRPYQSQAIQECWEALKKDDNPVLLMASVGAGKSLMLADILLKMEKLGKRALCLVNNAELVRNNCETYKSYGGQASIYCATLKSKDTKYPIIFGSPQTILNGINKNGEISKIKFNIIIVDEAHTINHANHRSIFMRIIRHYKNEYGNMRLLGATGTNFRFKGEAIVGDDSLFKSQVGNISTQKLIDDGYLIKPNFEIDDNLMIDFSKVRIKSNGQFDNKDLANVIEKSERLTKQICEQLILIMEQQKRFGVFVFATTKKHAHEILSYLPQHETALILGDTNQEERTRILNEAREGKFRYIVNIAIISIGVDVPSFDTIAYLRPTESLVLLVQTMGRALRLSPLTNKTNALILDYAGNIERHRDWDDPIIMDAARKTIDEDKPLVIKCPKCLALNPETARRCIGITNTKRCDYYFEYKECKECNCQNDIAARYCHHCEAELIDPNAKLSLLTKNYIKIRVNRCKYVITGTQFDYKFHCYYYTEQGLIKEIFSPTKSQKAKYYFYGQFLKKHVEAAHDWLECIDDGIKMHSVYNVLNSPYALEVDQTQTPWVIKRKYFLQDIEPYS